MYPTIYSGAVTNVQFVWIFVRILELVYIVKLASGIHLLVSYVVHSRRIPCLPVLLVAMGS